ncbi:hypothetical protein PTTG_10704, partial [Puccinia triticina 1-1 BBBD Race 1]
LGCPSVGEPACPARPASPAPATTNHSRTISDPGDDFQAIGQFLGQHSVVGRRALHQSDPVPHPGPAQHRLDGIGLPTHLRCRLAAARPTGVHEQQPQSRGGGRRAGGDGGGRPAGRAARLQLRPGRLAQVPRRPPHTHAHPRRLPPPPQPALHRRRPLLRPARPRHRPPRRQQHQGGQGDRRGRPCGLPDVPSTGHRGCRRRRRPNHPHPRRRRRYRGCLQVSRRHCAQGRPQRLGHHLLRPHRLQRRGAQRAGPFDEQFLHLQVRRAARRPWICVIEEGAQAGPRSAGQQAAGGVRDGRGPAGRRDLHVSGPAPPRPALLSHPRHDRPAAALQVRHLRHPRRLRRRHARQEAARLQLASHRCRQPSSPLPHAHRPACAPNSCPALASCFLKHLSLPLCCIITPTCSTYTHSPILFALACTNLSHTMHLIYFGFPSLCLHTHISFTLIYFAIEYSFRALFHSNGFCGLRGNRAIHNRE